MGISSIVVLAGPYTGNGLSDEYSYPFIIQAKEDIKVWETTDAGVRTLLEVDTDYTVAGLGVTGGGTVTRVAGVLPVDYTWYMKSDRTEDQETSFRNQGSFFPGSHEDQFDHLTKLVNQHRDTNDRSLRVDDGYSASIDMTIPDPIAGYAFKFNDAGTGIELLDVSLLAGGVVVTTEESFTLTAGQLTIAPTLSVNNLSIYLSGALVDNGKLAKGIDFTLDIAANEIDFVDSYPAGTVATAVTNAPETGAPIITAGVQYFETVADMKLNTLTLNQLVVTSGFTAAGDGFGKTYIVAVAQAVDELNDHTLADGKVALVQGDAIVTITDGDATPVVNKGRVFTTANTGATIITDFDNGRTGQTITVIIGDGNTSFDFTGSGLVGNGGADYTASENDVITATYDGTDWICVVIVAAGGAGSGVFTSLTTTGDVTATGAYINPPEALANSATPSVAGIRNALSGGTTTITDFTGGVEGQEITLLAEHTIAVTHGTNIFLDGATTFNMVSGESLTLVQKADGNWYETPRKVNTASSGGSGSPDRIVWPTVENDTDTDHDIKFNAGSIIDSLGAAVITNADLVKQIDATWAVGTGAGGLFSGSVAVDTTYHLFVIVKDSDGSVDAGFDTSVSAANIPVGYTAYRRIASVITDGSSNILQFYQLGDYFYWGVPVKDSSNVNPGTSAITLAVQVPSGLRLIWLGGVGMIDKSPSADVYLTVGDVASTLVVSYSYFSLQTRNDSGGETTGDSAQFQVRTNTSGAIKYKLSISNGDIEAHITTQGYIDERIA